MPRLVVLVSVLLLAILSGSLVAAQTQLPSLTPEQQQLLNRLPPSQRQALQQQLRDFQRRQAAGERAQNEDSFRELDFEEEETGEDEQEEQPNRFAPEDTVVVILELNTRTFELPEMDEERLRAETLRKRVSRGNPYELDELGRLLLPGVEAIELAGLTEEQARLRLLSEPALENHVVSVARLPLAPVGTDALEPFGYELFRSKRRLTRPDEFLPVPVNYVVGPGDVVRVQLFGNQNAEYELLVTREGGIQFPEIGPVSVAGLTYQELRDELSQRVAEQFIGTRVSVTLGELRSMQVFVVGEVEKPGAYAVGSLATITAALVTADGVAEHGSLRNIQLKRNGRIVQRLDVYDLLLRGDTRADVRVQSGDVVFVPPVGTRVTVAGDVRRPAIYEYRGAANVQDVIGLAGGLLPSAYEPGVKIERLEPGAGLLILNANLERPAGRNLKVRDGDTVRVPAGIRELESSVTLVGNAQRSGQYQWTEGMHLTDLLPSTRAVKPNSDIKYVMIRRELVPNTAVSVLSADLTEAWRAPGQEADVELRPRDTVYVFDLDVGRRHIVDPLIQELQLRSTRAEPLPVARVGGRVNAPGDYPLEPGMRIADLIRAGGGLAESAFLQEAELTRYIVMDGEARETALLPVRLADALAGDEGANLRLQPYDYLNVKEIPRWRDQEFVQILGEVAFPGRYPIYQGETLSSVLKRAGGLTELAFPEGSIFTRESLKEREREQLQVLANRVESDLASLSLSDPGQSEAISIGQSLLQQLRTTEPSGRLVINLAEVLSREGGENIVLKDGDRLLVPPQSQEVTVIGEVQYATSHLHEPALDRSDYISKSGGVTVKADEERIYIVRANGEVVVGGTSRFFSRSRGFDVKPGDTVVVPLDTDRVRPLTLWTGVTQVLYNLAIAAAAVNSF